MIAVEAGGTQYEALLDFMYKVPVGKDQKKRNN
jgi:hypothetical protein